jgi:hypothetical protein
LGSPYDADRSLQPFAEIGVNVALLLLDFRKTELESIHLYWIKSDNSCGSRSVAVEADLGPGYVPAVRPYLTFSSSYPLPVKMRTRGRSSTRALRRCTIFSRTLPRPMGSAEAGIRVPVTTTLSGRLLPMLKWDV